MKNYPLFLAIFFALVLSQSALAKPSLTKIIGGHQVPQEEKHPGHFNTVALVKEDGKIFCSGSIVAENLVVTAKHCLMDKKDQKLRLYFGDDTTQAKDDLYRPIVAHDVRHPTDWTMTFPSFDIAWVKFEGELPRPFRPLPILTNPENLRPGARILQVGYGDHNPNVGEVEAGQKLWGETRLLRYINNPRFFHILLFHGEEGQGSCHGDSGGPAYIQIEGQWFIIGVTNGFDVVLTPRTMVRTGDPDFPYNVDCSKNQSLYSFVGAHGRWIEETSGVVIEKRSPFVTADRTESLTPETLGQWCKLQDIGSPQWNLLKILLDKKVDSMPQSEASEFYENCDEIVTYLESLDTISLDHETVMEGTLGFEPLKLLPNLKKLALYNFPRELIQIETIKDLDIDELILKNIGLMDLRKLQKNKVRKLSLEQNPLYGLRGIEILDGVEEVTLSGTPVKDLSPLSSFNLKALYAGGINSPVVFGIDNLAQDLEILDLKNTIVANSKVLSLMKNLKELYVTGDMGAIDLSELTNLEIIEIKDFKQNEIVFPQTLQNLRKLSASQNELVNIFFLERAPNIEDINLTFNNIRNLEVFKPGSHPKLKSLNLSGNPLLNVSPLANLEALELLRLFRTPIQSGLIPKTEENCPTQNGSWALKNFCR